MFNANHPGANPTPNPSAVAQRQAEFERNNCAFERVERLASNIGYLKFNAQYKVNRIDLAPPSRRRFLLLPAGLFAWRRSGACARIR
jgi:hypothetical protein